MFPLNGKTLASHEAMQKAPGVPIIVCVKIDILTREHLERSSRKFAEYSTPRR